MRELEAAQHQEGDADQGHHDETDPRLREILPVRGPVGDLVRDDAQQIDHDFGCAWPEIGRRGANRPAWVDGVEIELGTDGNGKAHALQRHEAHGAPPRSAARAIAVSRQFSDIADDSLSHSSSSLLPLGQNQPTNVTAIGGVPQSTAQGVKIEPMKNTVVAIAVSSGHMLGSGEASRIWGSASASEVSRTSRRSALRPATTGRLSLSAHSGSRCLTTGMRSKFCGGGGDEVAHSSVEASQGLSPASAPLRRL